MDEKAGEAGRFARWLDKLLLRFKIGGEGREEVQQLLHHPIVWLKGEALPFQRLAPWELFFSFSTASSASPRGAGTVATSCTATHTRSTPT